MWASQHSPPVFPFVSYFPLLLFLLFPIMPFSPELVAFFTAAISWIIWRFTRDLFLTSPLDNIPGPPSTSWIKGKRRSFWIPLSLSLITHICSRFIIGNLGQLYNRQGWDWLDGLGNNYNKVVKLTGLLGVCSHKDDYTDSLLPAGIT